MNEDGEKFKKRLHQLVAHVIETDYFPNALPLQGEGHANTRIDLNHFVDWAKALVIKQ